MLRNHLVIMAKLPQAGRVKTRLTHDIGTAEALRVYRRILGETMMVLADGERWLTWVAVTPDTAAADPYWPGGVHTIGQGRGDLGQRMQGIFDEMPPGPVVIIGSDVPGIKRADISDAFKQLGRIDVVFGPAPDGGYWLVGARRRPRVPQMFENVRWSGRHALADTMANLEGKQVGLVREIADLDEAGDYRKWRAGL